MAGRHYDQWTIGNTMRAETEATDLKPSRSRPGAGIVTFAHRLINQRDEIVCSACAWPC